MTTLNPDLCPDLSKPTCRVCLQNKQDDEMLSIFDLDVDLQNLYVYEKIEECAGIKVLNEHKFPAFICSDCYYVLNISYKFRITCRNSEEYLQIILSTEEIIPKIEYPKEQNPLSPSETITNKNDTSLETKKILRDSQSPSESITTKKDTTSLETKKILRDSPTPLYQALKNEHGSISCSPPSCNEFDEFFTDNDTNEVWLDIYYPDDEVSLPYSENLEISAEKKDIDIKEKIEEPHCNKKLTKRKKISKPRAKKSSKTLEISADGTAIIREKKSRAKRVRDIQPHVCEICGNVYNRRWGLEHHIKRHSTKKEFECEICGYAFHSNFELKRHMRKHTGSKPYKCSYCSRAFGDHSTLTKHERVHRNERPFKCDICGMSFSYTGVLKRHQLVHTGARPYKCEICGKCFNTRYHLQAHLKTVQHQNDPRAQILLQNIKKNNEDENKE